MNTAPFTIERLINAPVKKVWDALTDKTQMKEWYFDLSEFRAEPGFEFSFYGQGQKGEHYLHLCKVLTAEPLKKLSYSWQYKDLPGYSVVTFELQPEGDRTRVKLTHEGLDSFPTGNPDFAPESFARGWTELIGTCLPRFVEKA
ncbi:MAG: SRPBCC domain-containing protein [Chitinophagaceae bacterium]|nr:SRPBCC domain-containing protein [Chitinophagaceae bacterium]